MSVSVKTTRKNEKMAFISVEDRFGEIECILFSTQYSKYMHHLRVDTAVMIDGVLSIRDDDSPRIVVSHIEELIENDKFTVPDKNPPKEEKADNKKITGIPQKIYLKVPDMECKKYLKALNLIDIFSGTTKVIFYDSSTAKYIAYSNGIGVTPTILKELCEILEEENVVLK